MYSFPKIPIRIVANDLLREQKIPLEMEVAPLQTVYTVYTVYIASTAHTVNAIQTALHR